MQTNTQMGLPPELQERVMSFLYCDIQRVSQVCRSWAELARSDSLWEDFFISTWGISDSTTLLFSVTWKERFRHKLTRELVCRECQQGHTGERSAGLLIRPCLCPGMVHKSCLDQKRAHASQGVLSWLRERRREELVPAIHIGEDGNPGIMLAPLLQTQDLLTDNNTTINTNTNNVNNINHAIAPINNNNLNNNNHHHNNDNDEDHVNNMTHCSRCHFRYLLRARYEGNWDKSKWVGRMLAEVVVMGVLSTITLAFSGWFAIPARERANHPLSSSLLLHPQNLLNGLGRVADVVGVTARVAALFVGSTTSDIHDFDFYDDHRGLGLCVMGIGAYMSLRGAILRHNRYYRQLLVSRMQVCDRRAKTN